MLNKAPARIVIASRQSPLALWQAGYIQSRLKALYPQAEIAILGITTQGDRIVDRPLTQIGGKGLFVKELELAISAGAAAIAVHSVKDVPMTLTDGFAMTIVGEREDARDAFVCKRYASLAELPAGSIVGTSSLRREAQLRARYPHLKVEALRGNVETRLRKLDDGRYAAIILAVAGLKRLGLADRITAYLSAKESLPAVGQGALGIEYLAQREDLIALLAPLADAQTSACVGAERSFSRRLGGSCEVPLAASAEIAGGMLQLTGLVASPDGRQVVSASLNGAPEAAEDLGIMLAEKLIAAGADEILTVLQTNAAL